MEQIDSFEEFLNRKKEQSKEQNINWEERKSIWIKSVDSLFSKIKGWLEPFEKQGLVVFKEREIKCYEDYLGEYIIKKLDIFLGSDIISLVPKGTIILGSFGRIDMMGNDGDIMIIEPEWNEWKFARRTPMLKVWDLSEESFKAELQKLA